MVLNALDYNDDGLHLLELPRLSIFSEEEFGWNTFFSFQLVGMTI